MSTVSQFPDAQTPKHRSRVLTVMSEMRAAGYGYEDLYVALNAMGFPISRDACRRYVIPKTHVGLQQGQPLEADFSAGAQARNLNATLLETQTLILSGERVATFKHRGHDD